ncbi:MAG: SDR family NAD(P)-dependent oxidoreductase [Myxococcota bacterium]
MSDGHGLQRWRGKVAVVTGASSGIGKAIATMFGEAGMHLVLTARRADRLESLAASIVANNPDAQILCHPADARDPRAIEALFVALRERFGGADVLVNNAGLGRNAPLLTGATGHWREMLEVNVLALCVATREAVSDMRSRGDDGHVIHVSSMSAYRTPAGSGVYSATKHAVRALTEGLRAELRDADSGIRVTAISPGFVETEFASVYHDGDPHKVAETYGKYPVLQPTDIAESVAFVLGAPPHMAVHDVLLRPTQQPN